jgi:hypothetical protein
MDWTCRLVGEDKKYIILRNILKADLLQSHGDRLIISSSILGRLAEKSVDKLYQESVPEGIFVLPVFSPEGSRTTEVVHI